MTDTMGAEQAANKIWELWFEGTVDRYRTDDPPTVSRFKSIIDQAINTSQSELERITTQRDYLQKQVTTHLLVNNHLQTENAKWSAWNKKIQAEALAAHDENAQLKAKLGMMVDTFRKIKECSDSWIKTPSGDGHPYISDLCDEALSATSADVERWEREKRTKVIQECIEAAEQYRFDVSKGSIAAVLGLVEALRSLLPKQEDGNAV